MNFLNWFVIIGGLAIAAKELIPAWKARRRRDKEWFKMLLWALLGVSVASVGGIQEYERLSEVRGMLSAEQVSGMAKSLGLIFDSKGRVPGAIFCNWQDTRSRQLSSDLQELCSAVGLEATGTRPKGWDNEPDTTHDGVIVYTINKTQPLTRLVEAIAAEGVNIRFAELPDKCPWVKDGTFEIVFSVGAIN